MKKEKVRGAFHLRINNDRRNSYLKPTELNPRMRMIPNESMVRAERQNTEGKPGSQFEKESKIS